jgi:uncharacterized protein (DUF1778 family)
MHNAQGNQRVSARVPSKVYEALAQAASLTGSTFNQFIVQSAYANSQEVIVKERFIKMTARSATVFFDTLKQPPAPNKKLRSKESHAPSCWWRLTIPAKSLVFSL